VTINASLPFIITVNTALGSGGSTFIIPTTTVAPIGAGYNYSIARSDGGLFSVSGGCSGTSVTSVSGCGSSPTTITFPASGTYDIKISGNFPRIYFNNGGDRLKLIEIKQWGTIAWTSMGSAFYGCSNVEVTASDAPNLTTPATMDFTNMFRNASKVGTTTTANWNWDTSKVINMSNMFNNATNFNQNIGSWNTSAVTNMSVMFYAATNFNQNIGSWNTSAVTTMQNMFSGATAFNQDISTKTVDGTVRWNTSAVTSMTAMFRSATNFNQNIGNWNTSAVITMNEVFLSAGNFNQNIGSWNTSAVTTMSGMFSGATAFNQDISTKTVDGIVRWNTSAVTIMSNMFYGAINFNQNIGNWNTSNVTDMTNMFYAATNFNGNIGSWNTSKVPSMAFMFNGATNFNNGCAAGVATCPMNWNTSNVTSMQGMFNGATKFNQDISRKANSVSTYTPAAGFQNTPTSDDAWYTGCVGRNGMTPIDGTGTCPGTAPSPAVTVSTAMNSMFQNATLFNQNLTNWCVSQYNPMPSNFATVAAWTTDRRPQWGTCP
jgi:surface protein